MLEVDGCANENLACAWIVVAAGVVAWFEASETDFGVASGVAGEGEGVVHGHVKADVAEPSVEAIAEGISEGC